ncbi:MAG TPA: PAS domain-containing protein, partial [Rhizomicrobium sp.]
PAELPIVWSYKYDRVADTFTGRLSGERIAEIFGRNIRGVPMREIYPAKDYDRLFARSKRVTCEPAFYHGIGVVFRHLERYGQGERIMLPLADDGATGDGFLGATIYLAHYGEPDENDSETERWFSL